MKFLVDSFPYKPRQIVYYVRDNAVHRGVILCSEVKCITRSVDKDIVLVDYCSVHILPDSQVGKSDPSVIHCVDSQDVQFMFESCQHQFPEISEKEYNIAFDKFNPYEL